MLTDSRGLVLKFSDTLDSFLPIFRSTESELSLKFDEVPNKETYIKVVIENCVKEYDTRVAPHGRALVQAGDPLGKQMLDEEIFELCLEVNPNLSLNKVSLLSPKEAHAEEKVAEKISFSPQLKDLESRLSQKVIGQEKIIATVAQTLRLSAAGLQPEDRPRASFFFAGSTGVGKTELAKALAENLFGDRSSLIRIDGSEYGLPHEAAKLIGSPPGYVGHEEGGQLTKQAQKLKQGVLLIDEIEKADVKVHHMLLQLLDEGHLTDSHGTTVSFQNFVVILTTNSGSFEINQRRHSPGFNSSDHLRSLDREDAALTGLRDAFSPEFLNRLDHILVFNDIGEGDCLKVIDRFLSELNQRCQKLGFDLVVSPKTKKYIFQKSFNPEWGAREIKRKISHLIESPLSEKILNEDLKGSHIVVDIKNSQVTLLKKQ